MNFFKDKTILVTGGTGSFGQGYVEFLLKNSEARKVIVFSRDEFKQFHMEKNFSQKGLSNNIRFFLGDIRDKERLNRAFKDVNIVIHAAALKQVPALEYNPHEAIKTNIIGSQNIIEATINQNVDKVLLISTDKAAQPVNLYGATKLCAEKTFSAANHYSGETSFASVRYGNVIGSRGSIVEHLKINNPEKVMITHPNMTRFWITLEQSFNLVNFALENMIGGEIFIPKIPSMKLIDLVSTISPNANQEITGIRPGEKMHEVLLSEEESRRAFELKDYFVIIPEMNFTNRSFKKYENLGSKLPDKFSFTSNTNSKWLTKKDLIKII